MIFAYIILSYVNSIAHKPAIKLTDIGKWAHLINMTITNDRNYVFYIISASRPSSNSEFVIKSLKATRNLNPCVNTTVYQALVRKAKVSFFGCLATVLV